MDPISNKKDFEDLTIKLRDLAYSYIEKYNPSRQQTKTFLLKKYLTKFQGSKNRKEVSEIIDKGAIINFNEDISAFCPNKHIEKEDGSKLNKGDNVDFKVLEFNKEFKRVVVSHTLTFKESAIDVPDDSDSSTD